MQETEIQQNLQQQGQSELCFCSNSLPKDLRNVPLRWVNKRRRLKYLAAYSSFQRKPFPLNTNMALARTGYSMVRENQPYWAISYSMWHLKERKSKARYFVLADYCIFDCGLEWPREKFSIALLISRLTFLINITM